MSLGYLIKLSLRVFSRQKIRTLLTILAMGVGIAAILIFVSLGYGLQKTMLSQITTEESLLTLDVSSPDPDLLPIDQKTISQISKINRVEEIDPMATLPGQISLGNLTSNVDLNVCSPSYLRLGGISPQTGRPFNKDDEIVISSAVAESFGLEKKEILNKRAKIDVFLTQKTEEGEEIQSVSLKKEFLITGVIDDQTMVYVYMPISALKDVKISTFNELKVKVENSRFLKEVSDKITAMGFLVSSLSETVEEANKVFTAIQVILGSFGVVALIVAAIGMANTMTVSLLERTNEIGIMKAIGASDRDVRWMFLVESMAIALLGGLTGIGLNFLLTKILNFTFNILAKSLGGQEVVLFFTPFWFMILIIVFSLFVGIFSGFFPAKRAAQMDPLEALRYK